jgi:TonB-linked SusC/RagA family outer membrane protein
MKKSLPERGKVLYYIRFLMKYSAFLFMLVCSAATFALAGELRGQPLLNKTVTVKLSNATLGEALDQISQQASVKFVFVGQAGQGKTSLTVHRQKLGTVLQKLLSPYGLSYKVIDDSIIITGGTPEQPGTGSLNSDLRKTQTSAGSALSTEVPVAVTRIKGSVKDEKGEGLPGVSILIRDTRQGATTDATGLFSLEVPDENATLIFSFVGYISQEVAVGKQTTFDIVLKSDTKLLNDVVVVGYGSSKKENLTGAVSSINADKELTWKPVGQVSSALQGTMPGVTITQNNGQPGVDQGTIRIRGIGTLNDNNPLVLVDGVQYDINDVDANDIETVSVLKDAAASSIYGVRAANGVILVTTKRGLSKGKPKVTYANYFGWQNPTRQSRFLGAQDFMKLVNQTYVNSGGSAIFSNDAIGQYDNPNRNTDLYPDNDWARNILTGSGFQQQHSLGLAGGSENIKYRFSTNYFDQKGLVSQMNFNRFTARLNTDIIVTKKITFSADMSARLSNRSEPQDVGAGSAWLQFQSVNNSPITVDRYSDGTWGLDNPIRLQLDGGKYAYKDNLITGNFRANYEIVKGLTLSGLASVNYTTNFNSLHRRQLDYYDFFTTPHVLIASRGLNEITKEYSGNWFKNFQGLADYNKQFGSHSLHILGGVSTLSRTTDEFTGYRSGIPNGDLEQINAGSPNGQSTTGEATQYSLFSYFGRVNYAFKERYLLEANIRRDGSSRFADGQRWGTFPSFSAGWRLGAEPFMENVRFFQELKLRGSWGKLGNDNTLNSDYPYQSTYNFNNSYAFGGALNIAALLSAYPNSSLTWETTKMSDIGFDMTILNNKMDIVFDYYVKNTDNILLQLPLPQTTGLAAPYQNAGSVRNKGWEFGVAYRDRIGKDFQYNVGFNISDVVNTVTDMKGADYINTRDDVTTAFRKGMPIGAFFGYESEGIFRTQEQVDNHATQPGNIAPGDIMFKDQNGDGVVNDQDRINIGTPIPRFNYGVNLGASWKGIDLSALFQGVGKADIYVRNMEKAPTAATGNFKAIHLDSWTVENPDASYPRLLTNTQNYVSSSFWIRSGTYFRLKSVQLGYRFPTRMMNKAGFSRLRIFGSAQNIFTVSKVARDIDPESPNDNRYYPQVKTITFGLSFDL